MPAKQKLSQRKALRSAAARKGWETRRKAQSDANAALATALQRHREARKASMRPFMRSAGPVQSPPDWPGRSSVIEKLYRALFKLVGR